MIRAGIVGASGYTGAELMRILSSHPGMEVSVATANNYAGTPVSSLYPSLGGSYGGRYVEYDPGVIARDCDVVFVGVPHGESMKIVPEVLEAGKKVVDLSADFRFKDPHLYETWYGIEHSAPEILEQAVYGLTELNREDISQASLTANPGCYPTAVLLGIYPLQKAGAIDGPVIADAKSGVSGAGRGLTLQTHFTQSADSISPYAISGHRHAPEMVATIERMIEGTSLDLVFAPHLVPMNRGILCTMYIPLKAGTKYDEVRAAFNDQYAGETFIRLLERGEYPATKAVQGSNSCHIGIEVPASGRIAIVMTAIDNLVKGASGQAVQNMNLMCNLPEETGLATAGLFP